MTNQQITLLPGIGNLLSRSWQIYKERFWVFLGIIILPLVAWLPLIFLPIESKLFVYQLSKEAVLLPWVLRFLIFVLPFFTLIFFLIAVLLSLWSGVALLYAIIERQQKIGIKESYAKGWHKIISYFWISLLVGLITVVGFLLFIIPGIIFAIWFSLATYVLVTENLTGMKALSRSKQLVKGNWWKVFWRLTVIVIISFIFYLPSIFIKELNIVSMVLLFLFTPFSRTYTFLIYKDLRKVKEGTSV